MTNNNYISVCILSYNRYEFLRESLNSLIETSVLPLEVIVHDDGSADDRIYDLLADFMKNSVISRAIMNPKGHNEGVGIAVNRCFDVSTGKIVCKADQDLIYKPGWDLAVEKILDENVKDETPSIGALGLFKYHVEPVDFSKMFVTNHGNWDEVEDFVSSFFAIRRATWMKYRPFPIHSEAFAEDVEFKTLLKQHGHVNALSTEDYLKNRGFGVGPSTVVKGFDSKGEGIIETIHERPKLIND